MQPKIVKHRRKYSFIHWDPEKKKAVRYTFDTYEEALNKWYELKGKPVQKKELILKKAIEIYSDWFLKKKDYDYEKWRDEIKRLKPVMRHLGENISISEINKPETIYKYISLRKEDKAYRGSQITEKNITNTTINKEIGVLIRMIDYLIESGHLNDINKIRIFNKKEKKLKENKPREIYLEPDEIERLFNTLFEIYIETNKNPYIMQRIGIILILFFTGARLKEVLSLKRRDFIPEQCKIIFRNTKTGKERYNYIPEFVRDFLLRLPQKNTLPQFMSSYDPELLFVNFKTGFQYKSIRKWFKNVLKRAKIEKDFQLHDFRHNLATWLHRGGLPSLTVKNILNYSTSSIIKFNKYSDDFFEKLKTNAIMQGLKFGNISEITQKILGHNTLHSTERYISERKIEKEKENEM